MHEGDPDAEDPELRLPDWIKRQERNCDGKGKPLFFNWAPGLTQCPKAAIGDEVWAMIAWWEAWKMLGCLPFGGSDIMEQPAIVFDVLMICEAEIAKAKAEHNG